MLFRAFYALRTRSRGRRRPVSALLGTANLVLREVEEHSPRAVVLCFGPDAADYRIELFDGYHAERPRCPTRWHPSSPTPRISSGPSVGPSPSARPRGRRPARLLRRPRGGAGGRVLVMTGDRDMYQCASDRVTILYVRTGGRGAERSTPTRCASATASPRLVPDFIALRGDPSDGIPGAKGIGEKGRPELLKPHGSLEAALDNGPRAKPRVRIALIDQREELLRFKEIATLRDAGGRAACRPRDRLDGAARPRASAAWTGSRSGSTPTGGRGRLASLSAFGCRAVAASSATSPRRAEHAYIFEATNPPRAASLRWQTRAIPGRKPRSRPAKTASSQEVAKAHNATCAGSDLLVAVHEAVQVNGQGVTNTSATGLRRRDAMAVWSTAGRYAGKLLGFQRLGPGDLDLSVPSNECRLHLAVGCGPEQQEVRMAARVTLLDLGGSSNGSARVPSGQCGRCGAGQFERSEGDSLVAAWADGPDVRRGDRRARQRHTCHQRHGEVDLATVPALEEALLGMERRPHRRVIVDLTGCPLLDSSGSRALVGTRERLDRRNRRLALVLCTPGVLRVLQITGLDEVFEITSRSARPSTARAALMAMAMAVERQGSIDRARPERSPGWGRLDPGASAAGGWVSRPARSSC